MLYGGAALVVVEVCLVVYCVVDVLSTPPGRVRSLPKLLWLLLVLLFPLAGGVGWLLVGRPRREDRVPPPAAAPAPPRRAPAPSPDDDEAFLRSLRERAEQQRRAAEEQRRAREAEPEG